MKVSNVSPKAMPAKKIPRPVSPINETIDLMGRELAADIVADIKMRGDSLSPIARRDLNQQRIKALGLTLIQGGKEE